MCWRYTSWTRMGTTWSSEDREQLEAEIPTRDCSCFQSAAGPAGRLSLGFPGRPLPPVSPFSLCLTRPWRMRMKWRLFSVSLSVSMAMPPMPEFCFSEVRVELKVSVGPDPTPPHTHEHKQLQHRIYGVLTSGKCIFYNLPCVPANRALCLMTFPSTSSRLLADVDMLMRICSDCSCRIKGLARFFHTPQICGSTHARR